MTLVIQFAPEAEEDLRTLIEFIAERAPTAAAHLGGRILSIVEMRVYHQSRAPIVR